ncbi:hypothetical protein [Pseudomonas sp. S2_B07]
MNANHIANYIIESGTVNQDFINKHTRFALGLDNIGDGLRPDDPRERPLLAWRISPRVQASAHSESQIFSHEKSPGRGQHSDSTGQGHYNLINI